MKLYKLIVQKNQGANVIGASTNCFDLTDYKYAYICLSQTTNSSYGSIKVGFCTDQSDNYAVSLTCKNGEGNSGTHEHGGRIDISSLTGNYYFCFNIPEHGYASSADIHFIMFRK